MFGHERSAAEPSHHSCAEHRPGRAGCRHGHHAVRPGSCDVSLETSNNGVKYGRGLITCFTSSVVDQITSLINVFPVELRTAMDDVRVLSPEKPLVLLPIRCASRRRSTGSDWGRPASIRMLRYVTKSHTNMHFMIESFVFECSCDSSVAVLDAGCCK